MMCSCVCLSCLYMLPITMFKTHYLPLCDDVEGAALLSLPDDVLSFVIVFLMGQGGGGGGRRGGGKQPELKHYIDLTIDPAGLIPGSRSPAG